MPGLRLMCGRDANDPDPWPRPSPVGAGSAFAAVADARQVVATHVTIDEGPISLSRRRMRPITHWRLAAVLADGLVDRPIEVPHGWARSEEELAEHRGPVEYLAHVGSDAARARLVCDGLDYLARIYVDDELVAAHEGGFVPVAVELPTGHMATVRLVIDDPLEEALIGGQDPLLRPKRKIKGVQEWHDSRPGGIALGAGFHGTWARRWGSGGIVGPVGLHESGRVRLDAVFVTAQPGSLRISWVVDNAGGATDAEMIGAIAGQVVRAACALPNGPSRVAVSLACEGARPWRPDDPVLYDLDAAVVVGGIVSDADRVEVGFRSVVVELGETSPFELRLDGERHYVRSANYIPSPWPAEIDDQVLRRDIELARAAHLNALGVHAGVWARLLPHADRAGVLIYQDFPLQWSYDPAGSALFPGGPDFAQASAWLTAELVYLLYNHPSLVYWCGHNEPAYQLLEAFQQQDVPELRPLVEQLEALPNERDLDEARAALFNELDPTRSAFTASGLGASRPVGDVHDYHGSLSGGSATGAPTGTAAFVSEYGAWTANFSAARDDHDWHEQTHILSVQESYAGRRERFSDFSTWCFAGQLWAGWHAKVVTEKARLARFAPSTGHRYHFFVDHFGHGGAGLVDQFRTVGPAYRGFAAANRPLIALAPVPPGGRVRPGEALRLPVVVVNDAHRDAGALELSWRLAVLEEDDAFLVGRDEPSAPGPLASVGAPVDQLAVVPRRPGRAVLEGTTEVLVPADSCSVACEVSWFAATVGPLALFLDLDGIVSWTSFVVEPDGWSPTPGLVGPRRFRVTMDHPAPLRRRWTGEEVDPDEAPPDQYVVATHPVDVFDDVHVRSDGTVVGPSLPWEDPTTR